MLLCIVPLPSTTRSLVEATIQAGDDSMACTPCAGFRKSCEPDYALRTLIQKREAGQAVAEEAR
jgi:hypothetical protein